ncbi:Transcription factor like [Quillaja saponaria]|uniref:Transcription factor like n=1 Tax=Quillaja saponaria TaxID=32244 RepID=A0AAD7LVG0_QUISA|nr:Transcription factor like [Quillaja saponaria]
MENAKTQIIKPTFQRKSRQPQKCSEMGIEVRKSVPIFRRNRRPQTYHLMKCRRKKMRELRMQHKEKEVNVGVNGSCGEEEVDDEKEKVEQKIEALQRIVPGGESFGVDKLFEETAGYIVALQYQVKTMRALASFFEKDKRKFGG